MKSIHVIWVSEKYNEYKKDMDLAHAEVWEYEDRGVGQKVGYLPSWTEEDCKAWLKQYMA